MRCKHCEYPLWNIKARLCPECGNPFKPSDYEFVPNSVRFLCPHCSQDYYGTTEDGHLEPSEFDCVRCHAHITMDEMTLLPTEGLDERQTAPTPMPWRDRARIGFFKAWITTIIRSMFTPAALMRADPGPSVLSAWWFLALTQIVYATIGFIFILGVMLFGLASASRAGGGSAMLAGMLAGFVGFLIGGVITYAVLVLIWGALSHALLAVTAKPDRSIGATYQAICYASGANVLVMVPCFGIYLVPLAWIWWTVSAVLMVAQRQRVSGWRATLAVALPPVAFILALAALFAYALYSTYNVAQSTMATVAAQASTSTGTVAQAIIDHADETGAAPTHAIQLIREDRINPTDLYPGITMTNPINIPVANTTLQDFLTQLPSKQDELTQLAIESLPPDTIAYRLGDLVFTYPGIDVANPPDPSLWLVIQWRDPFLNSQQGFNFPDATYTVGLADATTQSIDVSDFPEALAAQNELRQSLDLPPLPPPDTVTHLQPATDPDR